MPRPWLLLLLVACEPDPPAAGDGPPSPGAGEHCALQPDNVLRADCAVSLDAPGPLDVLVLLDDLVVRRFASEAAITTHEVTLWGLRPDQTYTIRFTPRADPSAGWDEPLTTGSVPQSVRMTNTVIGTPTAEAVLVPFQCGGPGHLVLLDASDGEVLWYQDITTDSDFSEYLKVDGFEYSPEREEIVVLGGHVALRTFDWAGRTLLETGTSFGLERPTHHDVHTHDDLTYVLNVGAHDEPDGLYAIDGVYVFRQDATLAAEWDLRDHLTPIPGGSPGGYWSLEIPGSIDYTHGNGLFVDEAGDWILSFRALGAVLKVRGDLDAPDFGEILWTLTTSDDSPVDSDFEVVSSAGIDDLTFSDQHHAQIDDQGHLLLFDNGSAAEDSRVIALVLDEAAGTADLVEAWSLDEHCPIQSSAFRLPSGNVLATCATSRTFHEFEPGAASPTWTLLAQCAGTDDRPLAVRGQPVFLE